MSHLNKEQFEDILAGRTEPTEHLNECSDCRERLEEHRAVRQELRTAFEGVKAPEHLANRIDVGLRGMQNARASQRHWRPAKSFLAVAASFLIIALLTVYSLAPSTAEASPAEFARIHQSNVSGHGEFFTESDPEKLSAFFKSKLGFDPHFPELGQGLALRGCCVDHFDGVVSGSYVVETPDGFISVVVVDESPEQIGMQKLCTAGERTVWNSSFAKCNMAAVQLGSYTYCAVAETELENLTNLITSLIEIK